MNFIGELKFQTQLRNSDKFQDPPENKLFQTPPKKPRTHTHTHTYNERQRTSYVNRFDMMISVAAFAHRLLNYFTSLLILVTIGDGGNRLFLYLLYTRLLIHFSPHRCYGDHRRLPCRSSSWIQSCFIRKWLTRMDSGIFC